MKTNLISLLLFLLINGLSAQDNSNSKFDFGVHLSLDQTQMQYSLSEWVRVGNSEIKSIDARAKLGYAIGFTLDWKINELSAIRISPLFSHQSNRLILVNENNGTQEFNVHPNSIGLPIHYIFSPRGKDRLPYFFVGPRIHHSIGEKIDPKLFSLNPYNLSGEFGVGLKLHQKNFSISPQLSFCQGFTNLKAVGESGLYNNAISSMSRNRLSLSIVVSR